MRRLTLIPLLAFFIALALGFSEAGAQVKLVAGKAVAKTFGFVPADAAKELGFFKKRGLDVDIVAFRGGAHLVQGIAAGSVDIGLDGATSTFLGIAKGTPIKVVTATRDSLEAMGVIVSHRSGIRSVADIKGKRIGVTSHGAITDWLMVRLAEKQGWDPKTGITRVPLGPFTGQVAALKRGETDGFVWTIDGGWEVEAEGLGKFLISFGEIFPQADFEVMSATEKLLRERPEAVRAFMDAFFEAVRYMKANKEYAVKKTAEVLGLTPDIARRVYELDMKNLPDRPSLKREGLKFMMESFVRDGTLEKAPPLEAIYDSRFVEPR